MATTNLLGQRAVKGQEPYRLDIDLQSVTFYPNLLQDDWLTHPGRFKPYISCTIDQEKTTRKEMTNDIKNLEFSPAMTAGATVTLNERLAGIMFGPEDKELNVELWHDRAVVPDRLVGLASMPVGYLLQLASTQGASNLQQQQVLQPGAAVVQEQPAERYAAKFNALRQGGVGGIGTMGQSATGVAGAMGVNVPAGICRVVATVHVYQVRDLGQQTGAPSAAPVSAPAGFKQYEIIGSEQVGPAAQQYLGTQQKLPTQAGMQQPAVAGFGGVQQPRY